MRPFYAPFLCERRKWILNTVDDSKAHEAATLSPTVTTLAAACVVGRSAILISLYGIGVCVCMCGLLYVFVLYFNTYTHVYAYVCGMCKYAYVRCANAITD